MFKRDIRVHVLSAYGILGLGHKKITWFHYKFSHLDARNGNSGLFFFFHPPNQRRYIFFFQIVVLSKDKVDLI